MGLGVRLGARTCTIHVPHHKGTLVAQQTNQCSLHLCRSRGVSMCFPPLGQRRRSHFEGKRGSLLSRGCVHEVASVCYRRKLKHFALLSAYELV